MDVLSDILRSMRVDGSVYFCDYLQPPWTMDFVDTTSASFHLVRRGECWVTSKDQSDRLSSGDLIFIEAGFDHVLSNQPLDHDSEPSTNHTLLLCGYCKFNHSGDESLLDDLPSVSIIREEELLKHTWLKSTLDQLSTEYMSQAPGSELVVNKLTEIVLVELIRINFGQAKHSRLLLALSDKRIARALQQLHNDLRYAWTLDNMSTSIGMSRAAFAKKFKALVGKPMFEYLTRLRMQQAKSLLKDTNKTLFEVANAIGYESDLAFTRAFNKHVGITPTRFRKKG